MTTLTELKALITEAEATKRPGVWLATEELEELIAAVEALKHLVSCISETRGSNADAALAESRAALAPFGENDEQKDTGRA